MSSCKHLATNLKMFLLDEKVRALNMNGLLSFEIDLKQCEGTIFQPFFIHFLKAVIVVIFLNIILIILHSRFDRRCFS